MVALVVETLLGFLTFTGSLMAIGKLQEMLPSGPSPTRTRTWSTSRCFAIAARAGRAAVILVPTDTWIFPDLRRPGAAVRRAADHPHRRRRHAHGDRAAELLRRPLGLRHGLRARQQAADHRRRARRLLRPDPLDHHVQGHEPLVHQRAVRRVRPDPDRQAAQTEQRPVRSASAEEAASILEAAAQRDHRARLRPGGGAGAAQDPRAVRHPDASAAWT